MASVDALQQWFKNRCYNLVIEHRGGNLMGMFSFVSKWNKAGELFRTRQFILTFAKEEDLVKIEEVIKKRREELAKKEPNQ